MLTLLRSRARVPYPSTVRPRCARVLVGVTVVVGLAAAGCGGSATTGPGTAHPMESPAMPGHSAMPGHGGMPASGGMPGHAEMPGMGGLPAGDGLAAEASGLRFVPAASTLPANQPTSFRFRILAGPGQHDHASRLSPPETHGTGTANGDGTPVTAFKLDQTRPMHLYLIRSDLTGFQHVHPDVEGDGTWTAPLQPVRPGAYRVYASFITTDASGADVPTVLSQPVTVAGSSADTPLPPASTTTTVDGYTLTLASGPTAKAAGTLTITVSAGGRPVTDLQLYLDTYAHLTAFHEGDLAFAHLHPTGTTPGGKDGGPALPFEASLPRAGNWRLFVQFQTADVLHTAAVTLPVG
ncbi:hypothetical protein FsymDg_4266 [Candidatus Protofrankia datiscae]|uniref:Secreted protein n=2 Tax=Frankiaceae TaxID=74712 RepID=F8AXV6_9ACTN|nr:hypothetical protein FsymDg_4266 [Candidatus Protofrankia datiscae]